jgi:hypothetical protein
MKRNSLLLAISLLASIWVGLPVSAAARLSIQQPSDAEREAYEKFYNEKDEAKKLDLARDFVGKFPQSQYAKPVDSYILGALGRQFQAALQSYYQGPDGPKLDKLLGVGDEFLKRQPDQAYVTTYMALATGAGVLGGFYKDIPKASALADKAVALLEPTTPPQGFKPDEWNNLRATGMSTLNQYKGLYFMKSEPIKADEAIAFFDKAAEMKDGPAAKDPNTYYLRASAYNTKYDELSGKYRALPDDQKTADSGKAILAKVDPIVDKMIEDYARVYALSNKPELKQLRDASKEMVDQFWKYRKGGKLDGLDQYLKQFDTNPTAPHPVPATAATTSNDGAAASSEKAGNSDAPPATRARSSKAHP